MSRNSTLKSMLRQRLQSDRLLWLFLATATVSLTVLLGVLYYGRGQILKQAEQSAGNLAWVFESRLSSTLQRVESDMQQMARLLDAPLMARTNAVLERTRVETLLADHVAAFPGALRITVFDAQGALLYSSDRAVSRAVNIADTPEFRRLCEDPGLGTLYSEVVTARADARPTVVVARALVAPDGKFLGQLSTLLDLGHFQRLIDSVDLGADGVVFIRRSDDNRLVLRRPELPAEINLTLDSPAWRRVHGGEASGAASAVSPIDKVMRIQSFRVLQDRPFYVVVALANGDILAGWRRQALIICGLATLSLALFGILMRSLHKAERRRDFALQALTQSEHELRVAATAFGSQEAMLITDERFVVLKVNGAFTRVTGFSADEVMGRNAWGWRNSEPGDVSDAIQIEALSDIGFWAGEIGSRRKNGEAFAASVTISAVSDDGGRVTHYVASFTDISERKAAEQSIHTLAFYDPLTHLPNRRLLMERLQHAMTVSERNRAQCALVFLDMDHFKLINDTRGHALGDALLVAVAERLRHCVRASDTVTRQGGDEFVVMLEGLDTEIAAAAARAGDVAEKVRIALAEPFMLEGSEYHGSASLGVCLFCGNDIDTNDLFKRCDTAMYQAKQAGRNALRFFDPEMQSALERRAALDADLRQAIALRQLELHYQVQVDRDGRAIGAEALLRWRHPQRGLVPPLDFIPLAEETGGIIGIGQWVLDAGCDQLAQWAAHPLTCDLRLAVNVSARQFRQDNFVDSVQESLLRSGARATHLELELTESLVMGDVADTIAKMEALRALGVAFSVDDFGTGYSSLAYLQRLPLDQLKIDRSFIIEVTHDGQSAAIVRSIITLAKVLGLSVIAEGVETEAQRDVLDALGCDCLLYTSQCQHLVTIQIRHADVQAD